METKTDRKTRWLLVLALLLVLCLVRSCVREDHLTRGNQAMHTMHVYEQLVATGEYLLPQGDLTWFQYLNQYDAVMKLFYGLRICTISSARPFGISSALEPIPRRGLRCPRRNWIGPWNTARQDGGFVRPSRCISISPASWIIRRRWPAWGRISPVLWAMAIFWMRISNCSSSGWRGSFPSTCCTGPMKNSRPLAERSLGGYFA